MWLHGGGFPASRQLPHGFSTALRPTVEPIVLARKPCDGTLQHNFTKHGTGALNIEGCRAANSHHRARGRRPANVILSHGRTCASLQCERSCPLHLLGERHRFYFCTKPSRRQRDAGCEHLQRRVTQTFKLRPEQLPAAEANPVANFHPTVKPLDLMRWLVRLLTPPLRDAGCGAIVLDPFAGSGSTGAAAVMEGARFLGIEREADYVPIARARIKHWAKSTERRRNER